MHLDSLDYLNSCHLPGTIAMTSKRFSIITELVGRA